MRDRLDAEEQQHKDEDENDRPKEMNAEPPADHHADDYRPEKPPKIGFALFFHWAW